MLEEIDLNFCIGLTDISNLIFVESIYYSPKMCNFDTENYNIIDYCMEDM